MEDGWSIKKMIREHRADPHLSARQQPRRRATYKVDPDNTLLWRMPARRLDAEAIRDAMLAVSGKLDRTPPQGLAGSATRRKAKPRSRRSGRARQRIAASTWPWSAAAAAGDRWRCSTSPIRTWSSAQRDVTTVPAQALFLMNSPFVLEQCASVRRPAAGDAGPRRRRPRRPGLPAAPWAARRRDAEQRARSGLHPR